MSSEKIYYICDICKNNFDNEEYLLTNNTQKCILHCEKNDWFEIEDNLKNWIKSENKIKYFWKKIRNLISSVSDKEKEILDFKNTIFPQFEYIHYLNSKTKAFNYKLGNKEFNFIKYELEGLASYSRQPEFVIDVNIDFSNSTFLDDINFNYYKFKKFTCFNNVKFHGKCSFKYTEFNEVSFDNVNFFKEVIFENSILNFINYDSEKDFENTIFHDDIKFYTSKFSTVESNKAYDIKFIGTQFKRIYIMGCDFEKGICFFRDTKADIIAINSAKINFLYIESDVPNIHISNNKKEINKLTIKHNTLKSLTIHNTIIKEDFLLNKEQYQKRDIFDLDLLNLKESTFEGKVKIQFYDIQDASFYNTKFQDLADFYQTIFHKVNFERTDFWNISVFSESHFKCDVNFSYVKFWGKAIFRDTIIEGSLNLRDSIFNDEANFLNITKEKIDKDKEPIDINVANRETARVIKNFYDNSNNIIEANRFYKLEMEKREEELKKDIKSNLWEWLIFKFHEISSNHSQDWLLSLFWIFIISFGVEVFKKIEVIYYSLAIILPLIFILFIFEFKSNKTVFNVLLIGIGLFFYILYGYVTKDYKLYCFSNNLNPFSIMTGVDKLNILELLYKVIIAYLLYQFIISIRQNTRRK
ncbi:MAG: pentapeptide repeat-containing protein [Aliarcobacter sp.]|nr:pentapeptide repeat-containing protein [Aliarcobacter sp.]